MSRWLSLLGLGALALAAVAVTVAIRKQSEPPPNDPTNPLADRGVGLRRVAALDYYTQFSVN